MTALAPELRERMAAIELLLLDVDGVLSDGRLIYHSDGSESKAFYAGDGLGIKLLMDQGVGIGVVTGRISPPVNHRCRSLGIDLVFAGVMDKGTVLPEIVERTGVPPERMAFVGDDLIDLPLLRRVGLAVAVGNAHEMVKNAADLVLRRHGGYGAVRELCEGILKARGCWSAAVARFADPDDRAADETPLPADRSMQ